MKLSHKTNIDVCFIIQQLTLDNLFKCDCAGHKKKHGFTSLQNGKFELTSPSKKPIGT